MMMRFDLSSVKGTPASGSANGAAHNDVEVSPPVAATPTGRRAYRRTKRSLGPRTYRTRLDPFAQVWSEIEGWLREALKRTVTSVFADLQARYSGVYVDGQVR